MISPLLLLFALLLMPSCATIQPLREERARGDSQDRIMMNADQPDVASAPSDDANSTAVRRESSPIGLYQVTPQRFISISESSNEAVQLLSVDYESGQLNTLWRSTADSYFSGPGRAISYPVTLKITFIRDDQGAVTKLIWRQDGEPERTALKLQLRETLVSFQNGDVRLSGTLISPSTQGPHPVVIVVPGAFRTSRDFLRYFAHNFVSRGIAALVYDARGTGDSTGMVGVGSFNSFADDVLAAIQLLKRREDVNPKQIALFGFSNSAWTVALAASRSRDVAFLITQSLSGLPPWQQEIFRVESQLSADGFSKVVIQDAVAFMRLKFEVGRTGQGWEQLQELAGDASSGGWLSYASPPDSLASLQRFWETQASYDPLPSLENLRCPVLAFWGGKDRYVPVQESIAIFERALKKAANSDYTIKLFPTGRHDLVEGETGSSSESARLRNLAPGYWNTMTDWLLKRVKLKNWAG